MTGAELADAAETLVGAPFRLHGRDPVTGLDCIGVTVVALRLCGREVAAPQGYGLRSRTIDSFPAVADRAGLRPSNEPLAAGDLVLVKPGPGQHHLLVALAGDRFVHAHAGLRRVVIQPGPLPWPIERRWRLAF